MDWPRTVVNCHTPALSFRGWQSAEELQQAQINKVNLLQFSLVCHADRITQ
jgi:hypothetical protein